LSQFRTKVGSIDPDVLKDRSVSTHGRLTLRQSITSAGLYRGGDR
jgi:hypothetical protein